MAEAAANTTVQEDTVTNLCWYSNQTITCRTLWLSVFSKLIRLPLSGYGSFLTCSLAHVAVVPVCSKVSFPIVSLLFFSSTRAPQSFYRIT